MYIARPLRPGPRLYTYSSCIWPGRRLGPLNVGLNERWMRAFERRRQLKARSERRN